MHLPVPTFPVRHNYWMGSNIHLIDCSQKTVVYVECIILSIIYSACHLDVNGIKPGSNSIMTDKHTAEQSKPVCLGITWPVRDVYIAHTTI